MPKEQKTYEIIKTEKPSREAVLSEYESFGHPPFNYKKIALFTHRNGNNVTINIKSEKFKGHRADKLYDLLAVLSFLKVNILNKQEIVDFLRENENEDGIFKIIGGPFHYNRIYDTTMFVKCLKLLGITNFPNLEKTLATYKEKKDKIKKYIPVGDRKNTELDRIYFVVQLMKEIAMPIDKEYWLSGLLQYIPTKSWIILIILKYI
jgi:hypothetical protein